MLNGAYLTINVPIIDDCINWTYSEPKCVLFSHFLHTNNTLNTWTVSLWVICNDGIYRILWVNTKTYDTGLNHQCSGNFAVYVFNIVIDYIDLFPWKQRWWWLGFGLWFPCRQKLFSMLKPEFPGYGPEECLTHNITFIGQGPPAHQVWAISPNLRWQ